MNQPRISFTALSFTAAYLRSEQGYVCFVEELPGVNSQGQTIEEARENLQRQAAILFDEERTQSAKLLAGKNVLREQFPVLIPRIKAVILGRSPARIANGKA